MKYNPIIILISSQDLPAENFIEKLRSSLTDDQAGLLYHSCHFEAKTADEFLTDAMTPSMFHEKKLIYVKHIDNKSIVSMVKELTMIDNSHLKAVFKTDREIKEFSKLGDGVSVVNLDTGVKIESHIAEEARKLNLRLNRGAVKTLITLVGEDLNLIRNELEKLALSGISGEVDEKKIIELTSKQNYDSVFSFISAVSSRDRKKALSVLKELELKREDPVGIVSLLTWRFRQIFRTMELYETGKSNEEIARTIKTSKGAVYYIMKDCRNFGKEELSKILDLLSKADRKLKSSGDNGFLILHDLAFSLCR